MTVSEYLYYCKQTGLSIDEMSKMTMGMCLDHIEEWVAARTKKENLQPRKATQADIQRLKGR